MYKYSIVIWVSGLITGAIMHNGMGYALHCLADMFNN